MHLEPYQTKVNNELVHSHHKYSDLAQQYGTPLYIFDEESFRDRVYRFKEALENPYFETDFFFASFYFFRVEL